MTRFMKALLCAAALLSPAAHAQYPDKPIRIVVPFAAGGGIDAGARGLAMELGKGLHQQIIVENRPGANSVIGARAVATSPPDGYTFLFTSGSTVSVLPHISKSLPFDPRRDFAPVGKVAKLPFFLVVHPSLPVKNLQEFLQMAKASPGALTYASAGSGTGAHLGFEFLKSMAGIDVTHVPYKATNEALPDLMTGRVQAMMADLQTLRRALADNSLRVLAVTTKDRSPAVPDVPTIAEQGIPGFDLELWFALFAPANTPPAVIARVNAEMNSYLKSSAAATTFAAAGIVPDPSTPQELGALAANESARWAEFARKGILKQIE